MRISIYFLYVDFTCIKSYFIKYYLKEAANHSDYKAYGNTTGYSMGNIPVMNNKIIFTGIITTTMYLLMLSPSFAGVYKWVDRDGHVHYGDKPGNADAEQVPIRKNETTEPRAINKTETDGNENIQADKQKNPEEKKSGVQPEAAQKPAISNKEKNRLCNEAKSDITAINSRGRMREKNSKGEYRYLSENERQQRLAAAKKKQREFCH